MKKQPIKKVKLIDASILEKHLKTKIEHYKLLEKVYTNQRAWVSSEKAENSRMMYEDVLLLIKKLKRNGKYNFIKLNNGNKN